MEFNKEKYISDKACEFVKRGIDLGSHNSSNQL